MATVHISDGTLQEVMPVGGQLGGYLAVSSASFVRPANTDAYAAGDLIANSVTAGSVAPLSLPVAREAGKGGMIRRARIRKSGAGVVNSLFRVHLYSALPTVSNGDNGAWLTNQAATYLGAIDVSVDRAFTDGAAGNGTPIAGFEINTVADTVFALIEARAAYTPVSGETFTLSLEILQN